MLTSRRDLLTGAGAAVALSALPRAAWASPADADAAALIAQVAERLLADSPESATGLGIDKGDRAALKHKLGDRSPAGQDAAASHLREALAAIAKLDTTKLDHTMQVNLDVVKTAFESGLKGLSFGFGDVAVGGWRNAPYVVIQNVGAFLDTPRMLDSDHQIENSDDAEAYLDRLAAYAGQLDGETERLRIAAGKGVIAPDFLLDKCLKQIKLAREGNPAGWGLVTSVANRTASLKRDYGQRAFEICGFKVLPAIDRQIAELEKHRARATGDAGVWKFPDGDAYYAWALSAGTTTTRSPEEVHKQGLDELAELQAQMDPILRAQGYSQGSVGERMTALGRDPRFLFPDNDEGRKQIIALLEKSIAEMRAKMPQAFHTLVRGNVEVKRLPLAEEPGAPGAYGGPGTIDGKVPGRLWINLRSTGIWPRYSLPDLAYHESIPGHAWQGEYTFKLPLVRSLLQFNAYSEGWALYAEQLADELGAYADDPIARLGYLQSLSFRACRLVVDTGLHAKRWTREQAIQWFATTNGSTVEEVQGEVDRYCSWPGQACGYKVGHSEINRLRRHAQAELGGRYDFRAFNDALLLGGNVPMTVLGRVIDRHIAERKG
ncbi:DUF885 domain-containing protein [Sphingomonas canadensis]|uniref:DUF885 domain-containing protein n=1 Tax=Sphingomonas canadensis TaxID=1219257 RepID=A0ABW3H8N9_9SPHN|nr:DUF885 domain-containing protein [Sphingomonas canadensis]MCW3836734.1 DUF885 domain-containing protein [Sphingomonas canadensis]